MSNEFAYADIIVIAAIAIFILLRLRSTLGKKTGFDIRDHIEKARRDEPGAGGIGERIIQLPERSAMRPKETESDALELSEIKNPEVSASLSGITAIDPAFSAREFLRGAKIAFEMVFDAFAKDDRATLRGLLADDVYKGFEKELDARAGREDRTETTLVSVVPQEITEAALDKTTARITVRFATEQVTVVRDKQNVIVEGDPSHIEADTADWTFERDLRSKNPNWKVIDT